MDTKEKILLASLELFSKDGYEAVSVSMIADALGITKGALYKHYTNKRDIFDSILRRMEENDRSGAERFSLPVGIFDEMPESYRNTAIEQLVGFTMAQFIYWTEDPFASRFRRMITLEQFRSPELAALYSRRYVGRVLDYHAGIFRALIAAGEICPEDPDTLAMLYVAPVVTLLGVCDRQPEREAECLERLRKHVELFFRMVHGKTPESGGDDGTAR